MPDETLLMLASEVRGKTLKLIDGIPDEMAHFAPRGLNNSILWHAGHAFTVVEQLSVAAATGRPANHPEGWFETFSWKSQPASVTQWPALSEVAAKLADQLQRLTTAVSALTPEQLAAIPDPARGRTVRYIILHGLHDEANHQGEMWLLRKLYGIQAR